MRLNLYVPWSKRAGRGGLLSRRAAGTRGMLAALLRRVDRLAPTWLYAPWRRLIQAACLLAFLTLFFYVCWPYGLERDHAARMAAKERIDAELFLAMDPLVSLSTALSARTWVWSLSFAAVMLAVCLLFPRGFCGYVCPLGTIIDLFDWSITNPVRRLTRRGNARTTRDGWWVHLKYYLLVGSLAASVLGITVSGFVAAIPVVTRGLVFILGPLQMGLFNGWHLVPPMDVGQWVSIVLFLVVLVLGFLRPRFWCRYVCPTGAVFSVGNLLRVAERKVRSSCIRCGKCVEACPFDAINPDFTTRTADCTLCQTCGGACPPQAIQFVGRSKPSPHFRGAGEGGPRGREDPVGGEPAPQATGLHWLGQSPSAAPAPSRRGFLLGTCGGAAAGVAAALGIRHQTTAAASASPLVRPPGSVPEPDFLRLCIRCGECFKACPYHVLQPVGFERGLDHLWTPQVVARWSGCEPSCNNCGQVCPTGAIRALPIAEKRGARMGLAVVNERTCLPFAGREACQFCVDECTAAGYHAIEFRLVHVQTDGEGNPIEDTGYRAPVVLADKCVGCGLCEARCHGINVKEKRLLSASAIIVEAGAGKEDRLRRGSYRALRDQERKQREAEQRRRTIEAGGDDYFTDVPSARTQPGAGR